MALTQSELIESLQNETRILVHLCSKIEPGMLDYRPTPKQRSTIELLRYLAVMGPQLVAATKSGNFDQAAWGQAMEHAATLDFDALVKVAESLADLYAAEVGAMSEEDLAATIQPFGFPVSRGKFLVDWTLCGHAAYRTQLFCYLKLNGREELSTSNLWMGTDPQPAA
jgi:hypothetical protein